MGPLAKVLIVSSFLGLMGCGSGGGDPAALTVAYSTKYSEMLYFYNPTASSVEVEVLATIVDPQPQPKFKLAPEDVYHTIAPGEPVSVAGCSDVIAGSQIRVCWAENYEQAALYLLDRMPIVLARVRTFGEPGEVDVLVGNSASYEWGGQFTGTDRVAFVQSSTTATSTILNVAVHELTHAAFHTMTGTSLPRWLDEAIAAATDKTPWPWEFDGLGIMATPLDRAGYARVSAIGALLDELSPAWLRSALVSDDPIRGLTGLDKSVFFRQFWQRHKDRQPFAKPGRQVVPPYSLLAIPGYFSGEIRASAPLEQL